MNLQNVKPVPVVISSLFLVLAAMQADTAKVGQYKALIFPKTDSQMTIDNSDIPGKDYSISNYPKHYPTISGMQNQYTNNLYRE